MCSRVYLPLLDSELLEVRDRLMDLYIPITSHNTWHKFNAQNLWLERKDRERERQRENGMRFPLGIFWSHITLSTYGELLSIQPFLFLCFWCFTICTKSGLRTYPFWCYLIIFNWISSFWQYLFGTLKLTFHILAIPLGDNQSWSICGRNLGCGGWAQSLWLNIPKSRK